MKRDLVVVGGGVAGLAAAAELGAGGHRVVLVEARDRLGGRIDTQRLAGWPAPFEAGAEFVHGTMADVHRLLPRGAARAVPDRHESGEPGRPHPVDEAFKAAVELVGSLPPSPPRSFDEAVRGRALPPEVRRLARSYVEGFNAADARRVSVASLVQQARAAEQVEGDKLFRVPAGYDQLTQRLAARCAQRGVVVRTSTRVRAVRWRRGEVTLQVAGPIGPLPDVHAHAAVVTVPLGVLKGGTLSFIPALPPTKRAAVAGMAMGSVTKVVMRFHAMPGPLVRRVFLHQPGAAIPTFWTLSPSDAAIVVGWASGPASDALAGLPPPQQLRRAVRDLAHALKTPVATLAEALAGYRTFDWGRDPLNGGAYSWVPVGAEDAMEALAAPVEDTLYFAGEATESTGHQATVHGALRTGWRVAGEIRGTTALRGRRAR